LCGSLRRPLAAGGAGSSSAAQTIDLHFAVLPAVARNKRPDPVFFFAGGPGQSALRLVGPIGTLFKRISNRRDLVFIDQRGTGRSAKLACPELPPSTPLAESLNNMRFGPYLARCLDELKKLPHGDLRQYTTTQAMQDADAVREALGVAQINVIGGSYGTRAGLEYMRQFPARVRRAVLDGVVPPDVRLPQALGLDAYAALTGWIRACERDARCAARHPALGATFQALLSSLPKEIAVTHPHSGQLEHLTLQPDQLLGLLHGPLYAPFLASALPLALSLAGEGRFEALFGLGSALDGGDSMRLALGMHFAVICAEDLPLSVAGAATEPASAALVATFVERFAQPYREICAHVPRGAVPPAFYRVPPAPAPTLLFSGGLDPVTPPRHGAQVAQALGEKARHVVVPHAGHGVLALPCMPDVVHRFIDAESDRQAQAIDAGCATAIPRPAPFGGIVADQPGEVRK
jgi:pimeloyl-ACP methyl ester carboxylesterase